MAKPVNQTIVIFGASGDLTYRKLIPALFDLYLQDMMPEKFAVLGVARSGFDNDKFREKMKEGIEQFAAIKDYDVKLTDNFLSSIYYLSINTDDGNEYGKLKEYLEKIDKEKDTLGNYIFYMATPPALYSIIPQFLAQQGLNKKENAFRRVVVEKPFGVDLESAVELNHSLGEVFEEDQVYRIDHYLGKETVQNLLVTRFANSIYEPLWNRNYIQHVEVTAAESIGVEGRGGYYDTAGALRDMVQNHLLQLLAFVAMEPPTEISSTAIRNEKLKVFQSIRSLKDDELFKNVIRGQYVAANVKGVYQKGYREEKGVNPESKTETFVAIKMFIDNWRWAGVPFYLRTGKKLPTRVSEIVIHFKPVPNQLFVSNKDFSGSGDMLIIRIQPDEGILLKTAMKVPGAGYEVKSVNMDFHYKDLDGKHLPGAYERLLHDCMQGDPTLYSRGDATEAAWKFVQPILDFWKNNPEVPLGGYPAGSWGPDYADSLIEGDGQTWRYPCKNLSDDGIYCEL